jgi:hypothetical protein
MDRPTADLLGWATCPPAQLAAADCCRPAQPAAVGALHKLAELHFLKLSVVVKVQPPSDQAGLLLLQQLAAAACWGCAEGCACCVQMMLIHADMYVVCDDEPVEPDFRASNAVAFSDHDS